MSRLIDVNKQLVRLYRLHLFCEDTIKQFLISADIVDAEPMKHGHWEWDENGMDWNIGAWKCSECRSTAEAWWAGAKNANPYHCSGHRYCSNCGAKMDEEREDA